MKHWPKAIPLVWLVLAAPAVAAPTIQEFPIPTADAQPQDLVLGPDGNIWFTERAKNKLGRISAANPGTIDEFPTTGTAPDIITVGPDGKLWYTEAGGIGVLTPGPAPSAATIPGTGLGLGQGRGIAVGPDGNVWVTDAADDEVIVIAPPGTRLGAVALPTGFGPRNIAKGPDGNMWVAGFGSSKIARILVSGTTRTLNPASGFDVPDGVTPMDVIAGNDGNLWYTAQGTTVGRMTPAGIATNFMSKGVDPFGIAIGPDGDVWYAEFQGNSVGRVDSLGNTSQVAGMTAPAGPRYVTGGPGDSLWFTEETGDRVGRVTGIPLPQVQPPAADTTAPDVTRFRITRKRFRAGGLGTIIKFTLSEDARVTISFERRVKGRWRKVRRKMRFQSTAGNVKLRFRGRFDIKHPLKPGRYRMTLTAADAAGNVSSPDRVRFVLLRKRR